MAVATAGCRVRPISSRRRDILAEPTRSVSLPSDGGDLLHDGLQRSCFHPGRRERERQHYGRNGPNSGSGHGALRGEHGHIRMQGAYVRDEVVKAIRPNGSRGPKRAAFKNHMQIDEEPKKEVAR